MAPPFGHWNPEFPLKKVAGPVSNIFEPEAHSEPDEAENRGYSESDAEIIVEEPLEFPSAIEDNEVVEDLEIYAEVKNLDRSNRPQGL